jgi:DNA gyrase subunit A
VFFATRGGTVKKTKLEKYSRPKKGGIKAILLDEGDAVVGVTLTKPGDTLILCSRDGQAIRFDEKAAREMGRTSYGVRGIRLLEQDKVVGVVVANDENAALITGTEHGYGKRSLVAEYPIKGRGGQGVIDIKTTERNGAVVSVALSREGDDVLFITQMGMLVRTPVAEISTIGRNTQGVRLVNLKEGDKLVALEIVSEQDLEKYASEARERPVVITPGGAMSEGEDDEGGAEEDADEDAEPEEPEPNEEE